MKLPIIIYKAKSNGSQEKEEEGKEEEEVVWSSSLPDTRLWGPWTSHTQSRTHYQARSDGNPPRRYDLETDSAYQH